MKIGRTDDDFGMLRKALKLAVHAHDGMRRKSKEPYVYHPLEVAIICARDMRLDATAVACAILHDVVEDNQNIKLESIEEMFNPKIAGIIDGLTKIKDALDDGKRSLQAEYFKRMIITLAEDMRVIMIKLADRLHNMRTLDFLPRVKQLKIASETLQLYAPLAYRIGLYNIKSELEDLSMRYTEPVAFEEISRKLTQNETERNRFVEEFIQPITDRLTSQNIQHSFDIRIKSVYSIWQKMLKQNVLFEELHDVFAVRIIVDAPPENERLQCWHTYSIITDIYQPKPEPINDWISLPKVNGYSALHFTVMSKQAGKWVDIHVLSRRMHEIAEYGYASYSLYNNPSEETRIFENWLKQLKDQLRNDESDPVSFVTDFKNDLTAEEIITFTPKGEMIRLPVNSTALDFAYAIHSEIGNHSLAAKVNQTLVPLRHQLKNGDQVEIITSKAQKPLPEWLDYARTTRAKTHIKEALKAEKKKYFTDGKIKLKEFFDTLQIEFSHFNIHHLKNHLNIESDLDLYYDVYTGKIGLADIKKILKASERSNWLSNLNPFSKTRSNQPAESPLPLSERIRKKPEEVVLGESISTQYRIATCCNPIPGDDVIGLVTDKSEIDVHQVSCKKAQEIMSNYGNRIVKAKWNEKDPVLFLAGIQFTAIDKIGLIFQITDIISNKYKLKIRTLNVTTSNEVTEGKIMLYVHDTKNLNELINELKSIREIKKISRMNPEIN